jgi:hypothetical protein
VKGGKEVKKVFSIALALAVALSMLIAVPVGAVTPGTIEVYVLNPLAGQLSDYEICFHNGSTLVAADGDFIDIMFPAGTDVTTVTAVTAVTGTSCETATNPLALTGYTLVGTTGIRIYVGADVLKCTYVVILVEDVTNPASCNHHLQVGSKTSTATPSDDYTIYTAKIELTPIKNFISLPAFPEDTSIAVVLADLFAKAAAEAGTATPFVFSVWYWDSWAQEWLIYSSDGAFSDLTNMEAGKAYWIKVNKDARFLFKGTPYPSSQGPPISWCYPACWSMLGIIGTTDTWASKYLKDAMLPWPAENTYAVSTIYDFDPVTEHYLETSWNPGQRDDITWMGVVNLWPTKSDFQLQPTRGYWMSFLGEACIIPPLP